MENNQSDKYEMSSRLQELVAALIFQDYKNATFYRSIVRPEYFESPVLEALVTLVYAFFDKYKRLPVVDEIADELRLFLNKNPKLPEDEFFGSLIDMVKEIELPDYEYIKDKIITFAKDQAVKAAMLDSIKLLEQKNYAGIRSKMENALNTGKDTENLGTFFFDNLEKRLEQRAAGETRFKMAIPTGLSRLDVALGGGLAPTELGLLLGAAKRGKSIIICNFCLAAVIPSLNRRKGFNVCHYVLESNEQRTQLSYDARISGIPKDNIPTQSEDVRAAVNKFLNSEQVGQLVIKHFPANSCSAWEIESHLQNLKVTKGFVPDMIAIDYLKLMKVADRSFKMSDGGTYEKLGQISKELLSLAQRYNLAIWVLHQSTRQSYNKIRVNLDDSADSMEVVRDADLILTVNPIREKTTAAGEMVRIFIAGGREVEDQVSFDFFLDKAKVRISESSGNVFTQKT